MKRDENSWFLYGKNTETHKRIQKSFEQKSNRCFQNETGLAVMRITMIGRSFCAETMGTKGQRHSAASGKVLRNL